MLLGDRFEWRKFTDVRSINEQGEIIDPFPGYPKMGSFRIENGRVEFRPDDGSFIDDYFLIDHLGGHYLLSQEQHQSFLVDAVLQSCVLELADERQ